MKALLHFLSGVVLFVALIVGGAWLVHITLYEDIWRFSLNWLEADRMRALSGLAAMWWVVVLYVLTSRQSKRHESVVFLTMETGTVSISTRALEDYLLRLRNEFAALLDLKTAVAARGADVKVELNVKVRAGTQIPELCRMLQERARQQLHSELGLAEPRDVRVNVREIVVPAAETQRETSAVDAGGWAGGARM